MSALEDPAVQAVIKAKDDEIAHLRRILDFQLGMGNYALTTPNKGAELAGASHVAHTPDGKEVRVPLIIDDAKNTYRKMTSEEVDDYLGTLHEVTGISAR